MVGKTWLEVEFDHNPAVRGPKPVLFSSNPEEATKAMTNRDTHFQIHKDIAALLHRIPTRLELSKRSATEFVNKPTGAEVDFPFGGKFVFPESSSSDEEPPPPKKNKIHTPTNNKKGNIKIVTPDTNITAKYDPKNKISDTLTKLCKNVQLPNQMKNRKWIKKFNKLCSLAVSSSTWNSRRCSFKKFETFSKVTNSKITWPLTEKILNGFVVWCVSDTSLTHNTIVSYIHHLSSIQKLFGFSGIDLKNMSTKILLTGAKNKFSKSQKVRKIKDPITLKYLSEIRQKIFNSDLNKYDKTVFWTVCTTAFFGCFRMGELLTDEQKHFDPCSDLLWKDITTHKNHWKIKIKSPKNNSDVEEIEIFKFKIKYLCPLSALKSMRSIQKTFHLMKKNLPVFRLSSGLNLTKKELNIWLKKNFPHKNFSCHSFRAGIPSTISNFPDLANDNHIMGWGRWNSPCFKSYQRFKTKQKKWVFKKICRALLCQE